MSRQNFQVAYRESTLGNHGKTRQEPGGSMTDAVLVGRGDAISSIARSDWEQGLSSAPQMISQRLAFMSRDHHLVRNFVVRELPRLGRPIPLADISNALHLTPTRTSSIVGDLEKNLFFLVRGTGEEVSWAFPVTAEETGHQLVFSTGERLDAA
jgi:hypothetical protein